jgi:hypothetical protein
MSLRAALVLVLVAGGAAELVFAPSASAETTSRSETSSSSTRASSTRASSTRVKSSTTSKRLAGKSKRVTKKSRNKNQSAKKTKRSRSKRASAQVAISRTPTASSLKVLKNMPRGYAWPPTEQMLAGARACEAKLDELGIRWQRAEPEGRILSPLTVGDPANGIVLGGITYKSKWRKPPHKMDCMLALAMHTFGAELLEIGVREVTFGSIYRWTNVRVHGKNRNMLSRHGLGIAMDIVSFTDHTGRVISVEHDYPQGDPLLLAVEAAVNSSSMFRVLLTPRNDPTSHHDHFHIEVAVNYEDVDVLAPKLALPRLPFLSP